MKTLKELFAPLYWRMARAYWGTMVRNGCPHKKVLHKYLEAVVKVNDLGRL